MVWSSLTVHPEGNGDQRGKEPATLTHNTHGLGQVSSLTGTSPYLRIQGRAQLSKSGQVWGRSPREHFSRPRYLESLRKGGNALFRLALCGKEGCNETEIENRTGYALHQKLQISQGMNSYCNSSETKNWRFIKTIQHVIFELQYYFSGLYRKLIY